MHATDLNDDVRELHDALEAVFGYEDGRALVVHESCKRGQYLLGRDGIEGRGRLVEHKGARRGGERGADGDPLALAARQRRDRPLAQRVQVQGVKHVLDPPAHRRRVYAEVLHRVGELVLDGVGDESRIRVLADVADGVGEVAGTVTLGATPVDRHRSVEPAAGEMRDEAVDAAEER